MTTDNTQELDEILSCHENLCEDQSRGCGDCRRLKQDLLDWHNKQVEAVLDRLSNTLTGSNDFRVEPSVKLCLGVGQIVSIRSAIEGERSKLKERDD